MSCPSESGSITYKCYAEFVAELSEFDEGYEGLKEFFTNPHPAPTIGSDFYHAKEGSITIIDTIDDELLLQRWPIPSRQACIDTQTVCTVLEERPTGSKARIIIIDYFRHWPDGCFVGIDVNILDKVALQYGLHPEILRLHFGCTFGLDRTHFPHRLEYVMSPCVENQYLHLYYVYGFLSAYFHGECTCSNSQTVVILARNERERDEMAVSGLTFLDETFPVIPKVKSPRPISWTNDVYIQKLQSLSRLEVASAGSDLIEFIIPYGNIAALTESYRMACWRRKVDTLGEEDLSIRFGEQQKTLRNIQENLRELQRFAPTVLRSKYAALLQVHQKTAIVSQEQVESLRTMMSYRASLASLAESRLSVEYSRKGIEYTEQALKQNNRVKRLTQLAFVFIPLSAVTSIFGMNLDVLNSGTAQIWMVVVAVAISYILVLSFWAILSSPAPVKLRQLKRQMRMKGDGTPVLPTMDINPSSQSIKTNF